MTISKSLQNYFDEYELNHKNEINILIHKFAIPLIIFHIIAMLSWIHLFYLFNYAVTLAEVSFLGVFLFHLSLNVKYAFGFLILVLFFIQIAHHTPVIIVFIIAAFAWILQFLGHCVWEKKIPFFYK